ncbi:hypothetical protein [Methylorubrum thiocyanatum]|uniref:hypothetical protein n=1 Tax=Methylorubrum thiocyanatum TaxID=47958 RepID=UPI00398C632C
MAYKRKADCTPEEWEKILEQKRKEKKKYYDKYKHRDKDKFSENKAKYRSAHRDKVRAKDKERYYDLKHNNPEKLKEYRKTFYAKHIKEEKAKMRRRVWKRAKPAKARQLMLDLYKFAPQIPSRDEIVAAAALLVLEGAEIKEALKKATTQTLNVEYQQKYAKQIEECFWL